MFFQNEMHILPYAIIWVSMAVYIASKSLTRNPAHWWNWSEIVVQGEDFTTHEKK